MKELNEYLEQARLDVLPFSCEEINEPLLIVYNIIEWAVRDLCVVIEVSPKQVVWKQHIDGESVGKLNTPISFRPHFALIVARDTVIRSHLRLDEESAELTRYCIGAPTVL